jgi:hypothetical protein
MTPAGLPASGSVLWTNPSPAAAAIGVLASNTNAPNALTNDTFRMATNLDQPLSGDVAKSLSLNGHAAGLQGAAEGVPRSSIWLVAGPVVLVLALLLLAIAYAGAFAIEQWAPPALFVLVVLLTLVLRGGVLALPDRWLALALGGTWGLAAWAALSATWAAAPAAALEGAGQLTFYAAILSLPLLAIGEARALRVAAYGTVAGICVIGVYALASMVIDGPAIFLAGRLNGPVEYRNATALLFCLAYWPLIVFAAAREHGRLPRALCFGLAEMMLGLAFLTQSRGVLVGLGAGAVVALLLGSERVRRAWLALLSVVLLVAFAAPLLTAYHAFDGDRGVVTTHDISVAATALLAVTLLAAVLGFLLAVFDAGLRVWSPAMVRVRQGARIGLAAVALVGVGGGLAAAHGDPAHELSLKWHEFTSLQSHGTSATRYTSTEGQRYDLWRVALDELRAHPLTGVGEGSYQFDYYSQRRSSRNLDDPHGLLFALGSELGGVGLLLFALVPLGLIGSLLRWWGAASLAVRREVCGLTAAGVTFIGQSLVDWMWHIPGLAALGMLCLGVAAALLARSAGANRVAGVGGLKPIGRGGANRVAGVGGLKPIGRGGANQVAGGGGLKPMKRGGGGASSVAGSSGTLVKARSTAPLAGRLAAAVALLAAVALTLGLYLSDSYIRRARDELGHSPQAQLADARTAASIDPWSSDAHYLQASALESMGNRSAARAQLLDAQRLEPTSQVPLGLLGDFEARGGNWAAARSYYRRALALNPLDVGLAQLARSGGRPQAKGS